MANEKKNEKMTKAVAFQMAITALETSTDPKASEAIEKIAKEIENLSKKKSGNGKPTAKQTANIGLGEMVVAHMAANPNQLFTVTDLMKSVPGLPAEITNQKLTALFRLDSVKPYIVRTMDKGKAYYQYNASAETADDEDEE
jgi:hypothetical protein